MEWYVVNTFSGMYQMLPSQLASLGDTREDTNRDAGQDAGR